MKEEIIKSIVQKTGIPDIVEILADLLSGSELNSLLLEVFSKSSGNMSPALLLKQYQANRFVQPAETDMTALLAMELRVLQFFGKYHFQPVELSPVAQLGSCSVVGPVDQKKIISAIRNTEVLADATNSIALHIASLRKSGTRDGQINFCTIHRHIRSQVFKDTGHTPHFKVGCLVSSGRDSGSYQFECNNLHRHFLVYNDLFKEVYGIKNIHFKLIRTNGYDYPDHLLAKLLGYMKQDASLPPGICVNQNTVNNYYKGIQFKMIVEINGKEKEIADGGFVDWTQQLLENKKERMLISGFGFELLYKIQNGLAF